MPDPGVFAGGRLGLGSTTGKPRHLTHAQAKVKPSAPQGELEFTSHDLSREDAHGEEDPKIKVNVDVSKVRTDRAQTYRVGPPVARREPDPADLVLSPDLPKRMHRSRAFS